MILKQTIQVIKKSPILPLVIAFLITASFFRGPGGANPGARLAMMRAMTESFTFQIDNYLNMTVDWAKTDDGHYYSNKAPGPSLIGFPIFFVMDKVSLLFEKNKNLDPGKRKKAGPTYSLILSIFLQVIPFALLVLLMINELKIRGISLAGQFFVALSMLFGNTSSMFMNTYFGHGMTAVFLLAMIMAIIKRKYFWVGACYGFALLTEYTMALILVPLLIILILQNRKKIKWILPFVIGGIIPGLLWIWFHVSCFESMFVTSLSFPNPEFVDMADKEGNILGVFSAFPSGAVLLKLLFGQERGLLFTQPWMLIALVWFFVFLFGKKFSREIKHLILFSLISLVLLLLLNSSFGGWHSGASNGPRYLCAVFPVIAFVTGLVYDKIPKIFHYILWATLIIAVIFKGLTFATGSITGPTPLWQHHLSFFFNTFSLKIWLRLLVFCFVLFIASKKSLDIYRGNHACKAK